MHGSKPSWRSHVAIGAATLCAALAVYGLTREVALAPTNVEDSSSAVRRPRRAADLAEPGAGLRSIPTPALTPASADPSHLALRGVGGRSAVRRGGPQRPLPSTSGSVLGGPTSSDANEAPGMPPMSNEPPVFTAADRAEVKRARAKAAASAAAAEAAYAAWEKEKPDPAATSSLHDYVIASMRELDTQGELDEVACRETLCRANVHFESVGDALKYEDEAGMQELRKSIKVSLRDQGVDVEVMLARGDRAKPGAGETRVMTERAAASAPSPPPSSAH